MFAKIKGLFQKKKPVVALTYAQQIAIARDKVSDLFAGFVTMHDELEKTNEGLKLVQQAAMDERAALDRVIAQTGEEIQMNEAMGANLLKFINPTAGGNVTTVSVKTDANTEDETRG